MIGNDDKLKRPRKLSGSKLTRCIIEGHYYKFLETVTKKAQKAKKIREDQYYVECDRCGNVIIINDKCYQGRQDGTYKL